MPVIKVLPDIYSVGVVDWDVRNFHGFTYTTKRGTTYNAYLIIDEKVALVDAVYGPFAGEFIENIRAVIAPEKIDYVIANHVETDHSGALPEIMKLCPKAKVVGTKNCKEGLYRHYYGNWDFQVVKTGDKITLGRRTLTFIEAAMIHWPDSMFTYCPEEQLLFSNDAFGQHYATSERFDDETDPCALTEETKKYYANILWPLSSVVQKKIEEIKSSGITIKIIAPSHGIIWRRDPMKPINAYLGWAKNETALKAVIVYETMWGATQNMAHRISEGIIDSGVNVKLFNIAISDRTEVFNEMLDTKGFVIGSSTHDNDMLPNLAAFLEIFKGIKPKNRLAAVFGSFGWAGGAVKEIEGVIQEAGVKLAQESISLKYVPDEAGLKNCYDFGKRFGEALKDTQP